ncbi:hypothetical protein BU23DRAFT_188440 [Bimuria novae-zelandiae CBS 107.79]|uniref:Uncharacterized protein n=1 Tax=Bimuria novae-zelandiae CBS 107.79 TaxID=1447943 RepID=A0A6A5VPD4_9PLEO|nr:hypothetical protein BU23DRAFT_188440 [Bimuria novae-zelandiae CBS 107.79]
MAEPASGIITLISASLIIIRETKRFIQETRDLDNELRRRTTQLDSLEQYVLAVERQCNSGLDLGEDVPRLINNSLLSLKPKLEELQNIVRDQASRGSDTLYKRLKTQIHMRFSQRDVDNAMQELLHYQSVMALSVNLGILQLAMNIDRRQSEASPTTPVFQSPFLTTDLSLPNGASTPRNRTLSNDSTVYEPLAAIERNPSVTTSASFQSQHSTDSSVLRTPSDERPSFSLESQLPSQTDTSLDLHYQINQARNDEARMRAVRKILNDRSDKDRIVEKKDQFGRTPLFTAVKMGDLQLVRALVHEFGADIDATDNRPSSVLEYALSLPRRDAIVELLIEQGADHTKVASKHRTALAEVKASMELRREQAEKSQKKKRRFEQSNHQQQKPSRGLSFGLVRRIPT